MRIKALSFIVFGLFMGFVSCDNNFVISESKTIESGIWDVDEVIEFRTDINQIDKFYNFFIETELNEDFLTNNLWLFIETKAPSGNLQNDTIMYYVADEKGKWFGNKHGKIIKNKFLYKSNIRFSETGTYTFKLQHGMRAYDLPKISKVGMRIEEVISETKEN